MIELGKLENVNGVKVNGNAIAGTVNADKAFGRALTAIKTSLAGDATESATNKVTSATFTSSGIGLYAINAEKTGYTFIPMAVYVGNDFNGVEVQAKGSEDKVSKTVAEGGESVSKGDKISYTVNAEYPYYSPDATNKKFTITDTLSNATFEGDYAPTESA